jgi:hypothetical protein
MQTDVTFLDCPEYTDRGGAVRCGLPAEVQYWYTAQSSDGPLVSAKICCPRGHWFNGPLESLVMTASPGTAGPSGHSGPAPYPGRHAGHTNG